MWKDWAVNSCKNDQCFVLHLFLSLNICLEKLNYVALVLSENTQLESQGEKQHCLKKKEGFNKNQAYPYGW